MADRIFDITSFSGWETDRYTEWQKNSFYAWENIEIRRTSPYATLSWRLVDTWWSFDWNIVHMEYLWYLWLWNVITCTSSGKIYIDWTLKTTLSTWNSSWDKVRAVWRMWNYYYLISESYTSTWEFKIHRANSDFSSFNVSYRSWTVAWWITASWVKAISINWQVVFWIVNKIFTLYSTETVNESLALPTIENIVWMTQFQDKFRIYTNLFTTWVQYIWDWVATAPDYRTPYENWQFLSVTWDWAYDYGVMWWDQWYWDLYIISGTQRELIRANTPWESRSRLFYEWISVSNWMIYISWAWTWDSNNYGIYTYWNMYPWQQKSLVQQYSSNDTIRLKFHWHWSENSWFSWTDNKVYKVSNTISLWRQDSWYIDSMFYEWNRFEELLFDKMNIAYELDDLTSIKIYVRTSMNDSFQLIKEITDTTKKHVRISANEIKSLNLGKFYWIQIRCELITTFWDSWGNTPKIKRITTYLNVVNNG